MTIPRTIHQVYESGIDQLSPPLLAMRETWKEFHPNWTYEFWDKERINAFIQQGYPQYWDAYHSFKYNVQRWDAIRYLILYSLGGMYVDMDYECIEPFDTLLEDKACCFAAEPEEHTKVFKKDTYFNNALIATVPGHPFLGKIIESVFSDSLRHKNYPNKMMEVLETTGPLMLSSLYQEIENKEDIYIIPAKQVSPFTKSDVQIYMSGNASEEFKVHLDQKLSEAIAVHYFLGSWI